MRNSELRFRRLVESNLIGVFVGDSSGLITEANDRALSMLDYSRADLEAGAVRWDRFTPADQMPVAIRMVQEMDVTGVTTPTETEHLRKDGTRIPVLMGLATLNSAGQAIGIVLDLTARRRIEQEMRRAKEAAEVANRAKSEFLANMSHEIRTPMNGIIGALDLVLETGLSPEQREYLGLAKLSADSLLDLLNEILDVAKIEARRLDLHPVEFHLRACLEGAARLFLARAREKGLALACQILDDVPDLLIGDEMRLRQVLANLLGNAVKFTSHGSVTLLVNIAMPLGDGHVMLEFTVRDTGIGIPANQQRAIFEPFIQADASTTRRFGGTGLGLTISARLVELMGGSIGVKSVPGQGSAFHFTAEFAVASERGRQEGRAAPATPLPPTPSRSLRVLLAEDHPVNQAIVLRLLTRQGHQVTTAQNGREVLQKLDGGSFDVVLMDVQMPEMDGLEATGAIREREKTAGGRLPIIAMTASAMPGDRAKCLAAGMDDYLSKPVGFAALLERLSLLPDPPQP